MYWIYLIIFTLIVFVPSLVRHGFMDLSVVQTQEFVTLILGSLGFAIFLIQDRSLKKQARERLSMLRQVNRMSKDLTHSYSYIGEINRKLDILESITLGFPESSQLTTKKHKEIFDSIIAAIKLFGKSDKFLLRFVHQKNCEVLKEVKSTNNLSITFPQKSCSLVSQFIDNEDLVVTTSAKSIDNVFACIIIKKKNRQHKIDDPEILKTLATQALLLFIFFRNKKLKLKSKAT